MYFRGVRKDEVGSARREQSHGLEDGTAALPAPGAEDGKDDTTSSSGQNEKPKANQPPFLFRDGEGLLSMTRKHNMTIAQL